MLYLDRRDAGRRLAGALADLALDKPVVMALPRGGVPVGAEVAKLLGAPLEIMAVLKVGAPGNPELAVGAIAEDGTGVLDPRSAGRLGMTQALLDETLERDSEELERRVQRYRSGRAPIAVGGRDVIVVDDGLATGLTMLAAVRALRRRDPARIVVAVPLGARESISMLADEVEEVLCLTTPEPLLGVGRWYRDFAPVSDEEVIEALREANDGYADPTL
jgi:predicted phosphoribosyltransferase